MENSPLISIVTPCWNGAAFIGETYESLRGQTYTNWEWLPVDDGSPDGTGKILEALSAEDSRVRPFLEPHRGLPSANRNVGFRNAKGEYIALLDADDLAAEDRLEKQVEFLKSHEDVGLVYSFVEEFWDKKAKEDGPPTIIWPRVDLPTNQLEYLLRKGNPICTSSVMFRRELLEKVGFLNEDPRLRLGDDWEFFVRVAANSRISRIEGRLVRYRIHSAGISRVPSFAPYEGMHDALLQSESIPANARKVFMSNYYFVRGERRLKEGKNGFRFDFLRSVLNDPRHLSRYIGLLSIPMPGFMYLSFYKSLKMRQQKVEGERSFPNALAQKRR